MSAIEQHLIRTKKRTAVSILLESAEPRDVHHFATLLGYGARAINPYLAEETIVSLIEEGVLDKDFHTAVADYDAAILHGIVKIASKMGISTLQSYQSAQIFEAIGINKTVIDKYFTNTVSRVGGIGLTESLALELAQENIRVNSICPGNLLDSPLWVNSLYEQYARNQGTTKEKIREKYINQVPMKRGCQYDDVANLMVFLLSDESSYMTGQAYHIDGGCLCGGAPWDYDTQYKA